MPNYLSPGVYVEEVSSGSKPIAGVGTAVGAFVGIAEKGATDKAVLVTNWSQYVSEFGGFLPNAYLSYAVYNFFAEGGTSCYVARAIAEDAAKASVTIKDRDNQDLYTISARSEGDWGNRISVLMEQSDNGKAGCFTLTVKYMENPNFHNEYVGEDPEGEIVERFENIYTYNIKDKVNDVSAFINVDLLITLSKDTELKMPSITGLVQPLTGGKEGNSNNGPKFIGSTNTPAGLNLFDTVDDINIVAVPDKAGDRDFILAALNYCKQRKDCIFIADPPHDLTATQVKDFKAGTGAFPGNPFNSSYGALYYPWVIINDPLTGKKKTVPPSGCVAGTYAYVDSSRGVHKAPAGITDGYLDTVVGIERIVTKGEQELLNPTGINVIRSLPEGICIWGARTLSADSEWNYVNVRRLMMYIEESVDKGSQWVVFEPNDPSLWGKVKRNLTAFLSRVWKDGALFGAVEEEAFFVKVDEENNPPAVRDAGQLIIEVGVAPVKPAEFVVIRVSQKTLSK